MFDGRSQLTVQHFMFAQGWIEGCVGCSFKAGHVDGALAHLEAHDVMFVSVSRAPLARIVAFQRRMGWRFRWVSSYASDFNFDFQVSFTLEDAAAGRAYYNYDFQPYRSEEGSATASFIANASGTVFHSYSTFGPWREMLDHGLGEA